jgi:hypothetical protein
MPLHRLHEDIGHMMGLYIGATATANRIIDFPEEACLEKGFLPFG